jgi:catechol 2,3-dioxygenase-like lactoylglutathione lyase family enzyme
MLNHVSIGIRDLAGARRFYDEALKPLGYKCQYDSAEALGYGAGVPELWLLATPDAGPMGERPGLHLCFEAPSRADVNAFHLAALKAGGRDNGKPGERPDYGENYYAAFIVDPEGYRLEAYTSKPK